MKRIMRFNFVLELSYSDGSFSDVNEAYKLLCGQIIDCLGDFLRDMDNEDNEGKDLVRIDVFPLCPINL